jgi:pimeloyl-ACP methyl ester carboxylesterase
MKIRDLAALYVLAALGALWGQANAAESLESNTAKVNGTTLHYVRAGEGAPLILIHGFPQDWSEYQAIMPRLAQKYSVIAVDLRGIGGSTPTAGGYDAANMAEDVYQLLTMLKLQRVYVVGHDIGGLVAYALLRRHPEALRGVMILDVPIPGLDGWDEAVGDPSAWHVRFMQVPELPEKLVDGRQADYFHYFFAFGKFTAEEEARFVKAYRTPAQLHAVFEIYRAFPENGRFNQAQRDRNDVPVFYGAGERSPFSKLVPKITAALQAGGLTQVESGLIPGGVHYLVQDAPERVADLVERHAAR